MFALSRVASESSPAPQATHSSTREQRSLTRKPRPSELSNAASAGLWTPLQRQQRLVSTLLQVNALSEAIAYEPLVPLGVDAGAWWHELKQQSAAAVSQRQSRKRRLQRPSATTEPGIFVDDGQDSEPETKDVLVDALVRVLQSLSSYMASRDDRDHVDDPDMRQVLENVESAIGDVGVKLLDEWWRAPSESGNGAAAGNEASRAAAACGVEVVNVLLQFYSQVGSFHAFHAHKLCCSTAQRLFRAKSRWSCSKCTRSWETQTATAPILVFRCAACDFTMCRECFTRIPNAAPELQEVAIDREVFVNRKIQVDGFLPLVLRRVQAQDPRLFASLAPKLALAARDRLQDLLLYRSEEMVPMMKMVVDMFAIPGFARAFITKQPLDWLPLYISSAKLRLGSFLGPIMWWTSMSDEPGEINVMPDSRRSGSQNALTLQWLDGYHVLRPMLAQLLGLLLDDKTQDPFVVQATLTYVGTLICCLNVTRNSGHNTDDLYDGVLINLSIALIEIVLPMLQTSVQRQKIDTVYHETFLPRRVYLERPEPLRSMGDQVEKRMREADDLRIQAKDAELLARRAQDAESSSTEDYYYPISEKHHGVLCDHCHSADFSGPRYKCAMCADADICSTCYEAFCAQAFSSTQTIAGTADENDTSETRIHRSAHVFYRLSVPVPLIAVYHFLPIDFTDQRPFTYEEAAEPCTAESTARDLHCADCDVQLDGFDIIFRCSNCLEPRFVCPTCVEREERIRHPSRAHSPGHLYMGITRTWRQNLNPCARALYSSNLVYQACIYPRERFNIETELVYMTIQALHIGPIHSFSKFVAVAKEMHELRAFCACEEQRVEDEKRRYEQEPFSLLPPSRRPPAPKLSAHYTASQARLADLGATRLMAEMHLLETTNVFDMLAFYSKTCRWLLELASPTQNAFATIVTDYSSTFSLFPEHFFFDVCDMVHVLTFDGSSGGKPGLGGVDFQNSELLSRRFDEQREMIEALVVMLVQLIATRKCTKNPHLRVQAAKALSAIVAFYGNNSTLTHPLRNIFLQCQVLKMYAVGAVLQFHEDMEGYHIRNNGLVFNNNAGSGDHLLWGFVGIRVTTMLLLRCMWQFTYQRTALVGAFHARNSSAERAATASDPNGDADSESRVANQVSMLIIGLWSDAAKLSEEGNAKVGVLGQLADIRIALQEGRQIQLPFRPSMLDGYIALHSKHLRIAMRTLVEVVELLSWMAELTPLKRAMLKAELVDQCTRTTSFLLSSIMTAFKEKTLDSTWHHLQDSKRLYAHLVILVARCGGRASYMNSSKSTATVSPSQYWSLVQESGESMLRYIGDVDVYNRWLLNRSVTRMESAQYLGAGVGEGHTAHNARNIANWLGESAPEDGEDENEDDEIPPDAPEEELDENAALAMLEQQSAQALTSIASITIQANRSVVGPTLQPAVKRQRALVRQLGNRFISALAKDGRFVAETFMNGRELLHRGSFDVSMPVDESDYEYVGTSWMVLYMEVLERCQDMVKLQVLTDEILSDIPEEYLDPLLSTIMTDPVRLPSGNIVDRAVIERHLLSAPANRMDPFTREPLTLDMLTPCEGLRREIKMYLRSKLQHLDNKQDDVLANWGLGWDSIFDATATQAST